MEEQILSRLRAIEQEHNVRILYAVESGSRAWGFASPNSDYDARFIYIRPVREYLRIRPHRDVIELPITDDLDINGWDVYKALNLFRSSNPPLLEWLHSPIRYIEQGDFAENLRRLAQTGYSAKRMTYHYLSMAKTQFKDYIEGKPEVSLKKYLYVMRPVVCIRWMEQQQAPPPTSIWDTLAGITLPDDARAQLTDLMERKRATDELGISAPEPILDAFFRDEIVRLEEIVTRLPDPALDPALLDALVWRALGIESESF